MLAIPPCGASSNIALWRAKIKPPVELVVGDLAYIPCGHSHYRPVSLSWCGHAFSARCGKSEQFFMPA